MIPTIMLKSVVNFMLILCLTFLLSLQLYGDSFDIEIEHAYGTTFSDDVGYTLIGEKPMSIDEFCCLKPPQLLEGYISSLTEIFRGSDKYVFKVFDIGEGYRIELIHRKALRDLISSSKALKQFIIEKFSNENAFLSKIEDKNTSIFWFSPYIRGILFGYGEENAAYFCRFVEVAGYLKKYPYVECFDPYPDIWCYLFEPGFPRKIALPYVVKVPKRDLRFDSFESEWNWLQTIDQGSLETITDYVAEPPYFINLPSYRKMRGRESEELRAKYIRARAKLAKIFLGKSFRQAVADEVRKK